MDQLGIYPAQRNTHPWRDGVAFERFLLDDLTRQAQECSAAMPAQEKQRRREKWAGKHVQSTRDRYGVMGTIG